MNHLDEWLARATVATGILVAISKEARSWLSLKQEQKKKSENRSKIPKTETIIANW